LGGRQWVRHKILLKVVTIVTILRNTNTEYAVLRQPLAMPVAILVTSLRGAGQVVISDKGVLLLELLPGQENIALIK